MASVARHGHWCNVSLFLFPARFIIKRDLAQHGALAAFVDEVGPGLVVVLPDGRHGGYDLTGDPATAG